MRDGLLEKMVGLVNNGTHIPGSYIEERGSTTWDVSLSYNNLRQSPTKIISKRDNCSTSIPGSK